MCQHGTSKTLLLPTRDGDDTNGLRYKMRLWPVDACIADIVQALNSAGILMISGTCCGHGDRCGTIMLADGRALVITTREAAIGAELPHAQPMTWDEQRAETKAELERMLAEDDAVRVMFEQVREGITRDR